MPRPLLLIVDGESQQTPGLVSAMEGDGWSVRSIRSEEAQAFLAMGQVPDLVLLDASAPGVAGYAVAQALRERRSNLPVLVLSEGTEITQGRERTLEVQAFLERTQPAGAIAVAIRKYRPEGGNYTTDQIFGDLLEDFERANPGSEDPFSLFSQAASPAKPPPPQAPLSALDIFGSMLDEVEAQPAGLRGQTHLVASPEMAPQEPMGRPMASLPQTKLNQPGPSDFTLSGIAGVNDPFEWAGTRSSGSLGSILSPGVPPAAPGSGTPEVIEEYGNYFLLEKIAVGGMAELFKAQQRGVQGFQKIVAIKRILPHYSDNEDFVTMFIDEAKLAAQLTHPNIVQIFDLGKAGSSYYIAMEYVNGRDLRTLLRKVREHGIPFPEQVAAFVVMKVAAALDYAHRKRGFDDRELKLVHRDISPQNVLISMEGAVKLVDFGIAKAASKASNTMAGALKGKLLYMSPEQALGQPLDNRSDLYSLGLVLFELITGERCFQADSELGVLEKVRQGRISDLTTVHPSVSRPMAAIVNRALKKEVDHRYPSARFLERDLRDYLQRQGGPITEHDVSEYMHVLLAGSRESLETLVSTRFPAPASQTTGIFPPVDDSIRTDVFSEPPFGDHTLVSLRENQEGDEPRRPRWLLPAILVLAVILVMMLAVAGRS